jgi:hypothetical protein
MSVTYENNWRYVKKWNIHTIQGKKPKRDPLKGMRMMHGEVREEGRWSAHSGVGIAS